MICIAVFCFLKFEIKKRMYEKILLQLLVKHAGAPKKVLELFAKKLAAKVTEEEQIEGAIDELGTEVKDYADLLQSESDRRVTDALKKVQKPEEPAPEKPELGNPTDINAIVSQAIASAFKPLQDQLKGFQVDKTKSELLKKATEKGIPARLVDKYQIGEGFTIEQALNDLTAENDELRQIYIENQLGDGNVGKGKVQTGKQATDAEIAEINKYIKD